MKPSPLATVLGAALWLAAQAWPAEPDTAWIAKIRPDHPRLFFNSDTWPAVKARALGAEKDYYEAMKRRVDKYPADPKGSSGGAAYTKEEKVGGKVYQMPIAKRAKEYGIAAMQTAFVYLVTGDKKYLDKTKKMLQASVEVYHQCYKERRAVNWYSSTRVCWLAAYDWIYNDLTPDERKALIVPMLQHVEDVQPRRGAPKIHRINRSNYKTGFYGTPNIVWFAGLAAHSDGFDDARALAFLKEGYKHNQNLFKHRSSTAGDDGGLSSPTVGYAMAAYPWAQFNFMHTWRSAIGENIAPQWPHLGYYPIWVMWDWIPTAAGPKEFGMGDTPHYTNNLPHGRLYGHMTQIMHFYGESLPNEAAVTAFVRSRLPTQRFVPSFPVYPFLMTDVDKAPPPADAGKMKLFARHFESMGQIITRSGWDVDDTYCMFTIGSTLRQHKHYDEGNFIIYRKGFLALDSGTRGISKDFNLRHYYAQTVAHNSVLIHMPNEPLPSYWGPKFEGPEGKLCHGGMNKQTGSKVTAFETNELFTYVAGDLTPCYSNKKCRLALRQFVHVLPDHFVVFDRVTSTDAAYRKQWLLHTQNEPAVDGMTFRADEGKGRLFCRTLLPQDAVLAPVGGPGREFWANGRNWTLNDAVLARSAKQKAKTGSGYLWGNWRVEVSPKAPRAEDLFLHLIQVGDQSVQTMCPAQLVEAEGQVGVRVECAGKVFVVTFATDGDPAGHIRIVAAGKTLADRALSEQVQAQAGQGLTR